MQPMPQIQPISRMARDHKALLTMIEANQETRPIFLGEKLEIFPESQLERMGHLWRYTPHPE